MIYFICDLHLKHVWVRLLVSIVICYIIDEDYEMWGCLYESFDHAESVLLLVL